MHMSKEWSWIITIDIISTLPPQCNPKYSFTYFTKVTHRVQKYSKSSIIVNCNRLLFKVCLWTMFCCPPHPFHFLCKSRGLASVEQQNSHWIGFVFYIILNPFTVAALWLSHRYLLKLYNMYLYPLFGGWLSYAAYVGCLDKSVHKSEYVYANCTT